MRISEGRPDFVTEMSSAIDALQCRAHLDPCERQRLQPYQIFSGKLTDKQKHQQQQQQQKYQQRLHTWRHPATKLAVAAAATGRANCWPADGANCSGSPAPAEPRLPRHQRTESGRLLFGAKAHVVGRQILDVSFVRLARLESGGTNSHTCGTLHDGDVSQTDTTGAQRATTKSDHKSGAAGAAEQAAEGFGGGGGGGDTGEPVAYNDSAAKMVADDGDDTIYGPASQQKPAAAAAAAAREPITSGEQISGELVVPSSQANATTAATTPPSPATGSLEKGEENDKRELSQLFQLNQFTLSEPAVVDGSGDGGTINYASHFHALAQLTATRPKIHRLQWRREPSGSSSGSSMSVGMCEPHWLRDRRHFCAPNTLASRRDALEGGNSLGLVAEEEEEEESYRQHQRLIVVPHRQAGPRAGALGGARWPPARVTLHSRPIGNINRWPINGRGLNVISEEESAEPRGSSKTTSKFQAYERMEGGSRRVKEIVETQVERGKQHEQQPPPQQQQHYRRHSRQVHAADSSDSSMKVNSSGSGGGSACGCYMRPLAAARHERGPHSAAHLSAGLGHLAERARGAEFGGQQQAAGAAANLAARRPHAGGGAKRGSLFWSWQQVNLARGCWPSVAPLPLPAQQQPGGSEPRLSVPLSRDCGRKMEAGPALSAASTLPAHFSPTCRRYFQEKTTQPEGARNTRQTSAPLTQAQPFHLQLGARLKEAPQLASTPPRYWLSKNRRQVSSENSTEETSCCACAGHLGANCPGDEENLNFKHSKEKEDEEPVVAERESESEERRSRSRSRSGSRSSSGASVAKLGKRRRRKRLSIIKSEKEQHQLALESASKLRENDSSGGGITARIEPEPRAIGGARGVEGFYGAGGGGGAQGTSNNNIVGAHRGALLLAASSNYEGTTFSKSKPSNNYNSNNKISGNNNKSNRPASLEPGTVSSSSRHMAGAQRPPRSVHRRLASPVLGPHVQQAAGMQAQARLPAAAPSPQQQQQQHGPRDKRPLLGENGTLTNRLIAAQSPGAAAAGPARRPGREQVNRPGGAEDNFKFYQKFTHHRAGRTLVHTACTTGNQGEGSPSPANGEQVAKCNFCHNQTPPPTNNLHPLEVLDQRARMAISIYDPLPTPNGQVAQRHSGSGCSRPGAEGATARRLSSGAALSAHQHQQQHKAKQQQQQRPTGFPDRHRRSVDSSLASQQEQQQVAAGAPEWRQQQLVESHLKRQGCELQSRCFGPAKGGEWPSRSQEGAARWPLPEPERPRTDNSAEDNFEANEGQQEEPSSSILVVTIELANGSQSARPLRIDAKWSREELVEQVRLQLVELNGLGPGGERATSAGHLGQWRGKQGGENWLLYEEAQMLAKQVYEASRLQAPQDSGGGGGSPEQPETRPGELNGLNGARQEAGAEPGAQASSPGVGSEGRQQGATVEPADIDLPDPGAARGAETPGVRQPFGPGAESGTPGAHMSCDAAANAAHVGHRGRHVSGGHGRGGAEGKGKACAAGPAAAAFGAPEGQRWLDRGLSELAWRGLLGPADEKGTLGAGESGATHRRQPGTLGRPLSRLGRLTRSCSSVGATGSLGSSLAAGGLVDVRPGAARAEREVEALECGGAAAQFARRELQCSLDGLEEKATQVRGSYRESSRSLALALAPAAALTPPPLRRPHDVRGACAAGRLQPAATFHRARRALLAAPALALGPSFKGPEQPGANSIDCTTLAVPCSQCGGNSSPGKGKESQAFEEGAQVAAVRAATNCCTTRSASFIEGPSRQIERRASEERVEVGQAKSEQMPSESAALPGPHHLAKAGMKQQQLAGSTSAAAGRKQQLELSCPNGGENGLLENNHLRSQEEKSSSSSSSTSNTSPAAVAPLTYANTVKAGNGAQEARRRSSGGGSAATDTTNSGQERANQRRPDERSGVESALESNSSPACLAVAHNNQQQKCHLPSQHKTPSAEPAAVEGKNGSRKRQADGLLPAGASQTESNDSRERGSGSSGARVTSAAAATKRKATNRTTRPANNYSMTSKSSSGASNLPLQWRQAAATGKATLEGQDSGSSRLSTAANNREPIATNNNCLPAAATAPATAGLQPPTSAAGPPSDAERRQTWSPGQRQAAAAAMPAAQPATGWSTVVAAAPLPAARETVSQPTTKGQQGGELKLKAKQQQQSQQRQVKSAWQQQPQAPMTVVAEQVDAGATGRSGGSSRGDCSKGVELAAGLKRQWSGLSQTKGGEGEKAAASHDCATLPFCSTLKPESGEQAKAVEPTSSAAQAKGRSRQPAGTRQAQGDKGYRWARQQESRQGRSVANLAAGHSSAVQVSPGSRAQQLAGSAEAGAAGERRQTADEWRCRSNDSRSGLESGELQAAGKATAAQVSWSQAKAENLCNLAAAGKLEPAAAGGSREQEQRNARKLDSCCDTAALAAADSTALAPASPAPATATATTAAAAATAGKADDDENDEREEENTRTTTTTLAHATATTTTSSATTTAAAVAPTTIECITNCQTSEGRSQASFLFSQQHRQQQQVNSSNGNSNNNSGDSKSGARSSSSGASRSSGNNSNRDFSERTRNNSDISVTLEQPQQQQQQHKQQTQTQSSLPPSFALVVAQNSRDNINNLDKNNNISMDNNNRHQEQQLPGNMNDKLKPGADAICKDVGGGGGGGVGGGGGMSNNKTDNQVNPKMDSTTTQTSSATTTNETSNKFSPKPADKTIITDDNSASKKQQQQQQPQQRPTNEQSTMPGNSSNINDEQVAREASCNLKQSPNNGNSPSIETTATKNNKQTKTTTETTTTETNINTIATLATATTTTTSTNATTTTATTNNSEQIINHDTSSAAVADSNSSSSSSSNSNNRAIDNEASNETKQRVPSQPPANNRSILILREIDPKSPESSVRDIFNSENCPSKPVHCEYALHNSWYVTFKDDEDAKLALTYIRKYIVMWNGQPIMARYKPKPAVLSASNQPPPNIVPPLVMQENGVSPVVSSSAAAAAAAAAVNIIGPSPGGLGQSPMPNPAAPTAAGGAPPPNAPGLLPYHQPNHSMMHLGHMVPHSHHHHHPHHPVPGPHHYGYSAVAYYCQHGPTLSPWHYSNAPQYDLSEVFIYNGLTPYPSSMKTSNNSKMIMNNTGGGGGGGVSSASLIGGAELAYHHHHQQQQQPQQQHHHHHQQQSHHHHHHHQHQTPAHHPNNNNASNTLMFGPPSGNGVNKSSGHQRNGHHKSNVKYNKSSTPTIGSSNGAANNNNHLTKLTH